MFRDHFAYLLLRACLPLSSSISSTGPTAATISSIFEEMLLYDVQEKREWDRCGRQHFMQKAQFYIDRSYRIEMALPAFPCKSTNPDKVASELPDSTEYEALENLAAFCKRIQSVYPPGCRVNVISDGHVFSDCTGVDDLTVTQYNNHLSVLSKCIFPGEMGDCIHFQSLRSLLLPCRNAIRLCMRIIESGERHEQVTAPVATKTAVVDVWNRIILIRGFAPPAEYIRDLIAQVSDHPITKLYRGFSRFMLDDLAAHPDLTRCESNSARKKIAESAALEMIRRNQAYSRLVEMLMPRHIRLSIHAHDNAGPKFAIKLMSFRTCHDVHTITDEDAAEAAREHLHIPTPWHSSLMAIHRQGKEPEYVVCKAKVAREFIQNNNVSGQYISNHGRGGRFYTTVRDG